MALCPKRAHNLNRCRRNTRNTSGMFSRIFFSPRHCAGVKRAVTLPCSIKDELQMKKLLLCSAWECWEWRQFVAPNSEMQLQDSFFKYCTGLKLYKVSYKVFILINFIRSLILQASSLEYLSTAELAHLLASSKEVLLWVAFKA